MACFSPGVAKSQSPQCSHGSHGTGPTQTESRCHCDVSPHDVLFTLKTGSLHRTGRVGTGQPHPRDGGFALGNKPTTRRTRTAGNPRPWLCSDAWPHERIQGLLSSSLQLSRIKGMPSSSRTWRERRTGFTRGDSLGASEAGGALFLRGCSPLTALLSVPLQPRNREQQAWKPQVALFLSLFPQSGGATGWPQ